MDGLIEKVRQQTKRRMRNISSDEAEDKGDEVVSGVLLASTMSSLHRINDRASLVSVTELGTCRLRSAADVSYWF